ncbi:MAG: glycosyltransferase family 2 protein, partial [Hyphomicrobiales bacterium]|nr:glycosyltransferase family 2 protein [Hyphomicrobiales bacterium]
ISLIIPALNEEGNIGNLVEESFKAIPDKILGELIVVDDHSSDGSVDEIKKLQKKFANLRLIIHQTNAGQSASLRTGILASKYPIIAQMDGDGQNDPTDIASLYEKLDEPADNSSGQKVALVGGVRTKRKDTGSKRIASRAANKIRDWVLRDGCPDTGCGIKLYWRSAFLRLPFFTSIHRYLPALFQTYGYQCEYVPVNDRPRLVGVSKYNNLNRALIGIYDLVGVSWIRKRTIAPDTIEE